MNEKKRLAKMLHQEIETRESLIEKLNRIPIGLISECFPNGSWSLFWSSGFEFTLPFRFDLIETVKLFMSEQFPEFTLKKEDQFVWDNRKSAGHFLEYETKEQYRIDRAWFQFAFRTEREGTTCVMNRIGEKLVPVYEVICQEGATEEL